MEVVVIEHLVIEPDRAEHIARHNVTIDEVYQVLSGDYVILKGKLDRWRVIGETAAGRQLTIIVGERVQANTFGLVTARGLHPDERRFYQSQFPEKGGGRP